MDIRNAKEIEDVSPVFKCVCSFLESAIVVTYIRIGYSVFIPEGWQTDF